MSYTINTNSDRISEEAHGDIFSFLTEHETLAELGLDSLSDEIFSFDLPVAGTCDFKELTESINNPVEPDELDTYLGPGNFQRRTSDYGNSLALMNNLPVQTIVNEKLVQSYAKQIELSQSVGVGLPQKTTKSCQMISIVHQLEEFYRPRYKSDYFTQCGKTRKPRYVADRIGNHFVSLKVPPGVRGMIRVDWITIPTKSGDLYYMPYRFQQSNTSNGVPDCNPYHMDITADRNGIMKLYLVLIKSKQDELKVLQPLKPFHPYQDAFGVLDKSNTGKIFPMNPKQLIQHFQLEKSQLAFTFCAYGSDGKYPIPQWDTTVYSTILTELPPKDTNKAKTIACPRCTHLFQLPVAGNGDDDDNDSVQEVVPSKRKSNRSDHQEPSMKQQKLFQLN